MTYVLDLDLLRKKLSVARLQREKPKHLIKQPEGELTEGLSYLVENVLKPLFAEQKIHSADLDFNAFDQGILQTYTTTIMNITMTVQVIGNSWVRFIKYARPLTSTVTFI